MNDISEGYFGSEYIDDVDDVFEIIFEYGGYEYILVDTTTLG